jgi:hypothetical protein
LRFGPRNGGHANDRRADIQRHRRLDFLDVDLLLDFLLDVDLDRLGDREYRCQLGTGRRG